MSMSTTVVGFRPPDETWKKMKEVYDSCKAAEVEVPREVSEFFGWIEPDPGGVEVCLYNFLTRWRRDSSQGFELKVEDIPKRVKVLRFYNSW